MLRRKIYKAGDEMSFCGDLVLPIAKRRSVTIDKFVEDSIANIRAASLLKGMEIDFTTALNLLAEYGIRKLLKEPVADSTLAVLFVKYLDYDELKVSGFLDEWKDYREFKEAKRREESQGQKKEESRTIYEKQSETSFYT